MKLRAQVVGLAFAQVFLAAVPAKAAPKAFYEESKSCGTSENSYLCISVAKGGASGIQYISKLKTNFSNAGVAHVSWRGSLYCQVNPKGNSGVLSQSLLEYYIHMSIKDDTSAIVYNSPGAVSAGEKLDIRNYNPASSSSNIVGFRTMLIPVSIDRSYKIKSNEKSKTFQLAVLPDWRAALDGFCNINGGVMSVDFSPN